MRNTHYIPVRQDESKYRNSTRNVVAACRHPDITDPFLLFNDDFFVLQPIDQVPVLHMGPIVMPSGGATIGLSAYHRGQVETRRLLERWGYRDPLSYELHIPLPIHKEPMLEVLDRALRERIAVLHKRSVYGNVAGIGGDFHADVKILRPGDTFGPGDLFVSTNEHTWKVGRVGEDLRGMFTEASPYEAHDPKGDISMSNPSDLVTVLERTKVTVRTRDNRTIQRVYRPGDIITAQEAERLGIPVGPFKGKKAAKRAANLKAAPGAGGEWVEKPEAKAEEAAASAGDPTPTDDRADKSAPQPGEAAPTDPDAGEPDEASADEASTDEEDAAEAADPLTCPNCGFVAKTENGLRAHCKAKHGGD